MSKALCSRCGAEKAMPNVFKMDRVGVDFKKFLTEGIGKNRRAQ